MQRNMLGIIAVVMLIAGAVMLWWFVESKWDFLAASCLRIGAVLGALWLALPQLQEMSRWFYRAAIAIALVVAVFSKYAVVIVPILGILWFFGPKTGKHQAMGRKHRSKSPDGANAGQKSTRG